jgi:hypothetical protein
MMTLLPETLLSESTVWLFGRVLKDIGFITDSDERKKDYEGRSASTQLLRKELAAPDAALARIYAFAFQNELFEMTKPALFLVHGDGRDFKSEEKSEGGLIGIVGLSAMQGLLAADLRGWAYNREDLSLRLDVMSGPLDRILLDFEMGDEGLQKFVRGGNQLGQPTPSGGRHSRRPRWRADDD